MLACLLAVHPVNSSSFCMSIVELLSHLMSIWHSTFNQIQTRTPQQPHTLVCAPGSKFSYFQLFSHITSWSNPLLQCPLSVYLSLCLPASSWYVMNGLLSHLWHYNLPYIHWVNSISILFWRLNEYCNYNLGVHLASKHMLGQLQSVAHAPNFLSCGYRAWIVFK